MLKLSCKIEIDSAKRWTFEKVVSVEIQRDVDTLTDKAVVVLPKKIRWQDEPTIPIKRGDGIKIYLGYDDELTLAFVGYITTIGAKTPIVINCEDQMFIMKQKAAIKRAYASVDLKTLLSDQNIGYPVEVFGEQNIGQYRQNSETVAALLNNLKEQGIKSFFKIDSAGNATLYMGVLFKDVGSYKQTFNNRLNIIYDDKLDVQSAADVKIKVKAVSLDAANKKTVVEVGDSDGQIRTLYKRAVTAAELKNWAEGELKRLKRDGLVGSFETFGHVLIDKLDVIGIILDGNKQGKFQVDKNTITFSSDGGFRQNITIGEIVSK